ncbi:hypothetical protein OAG53_00130 [Akkermansiaceae bacterium]|nr:hypothetical protein [Akkermansiaceae bacterium]
MRTLVIFLFTILGLHADDTINAGNFQFTAKKPWVTIDYPSHMVKGALTYGEKGPLLKLYHFGQGQGGGVAANMKRWKKQFEGEAKITQEALRYGEQEVSMVLMEGVFLDGGIMERKTPKEGYALLGAVIPHAGGDVFLKMTGPAEKVKKSQEDFKKFIATAFAKEK